LRGEKEGKGNEMIEIKRKGRKGSKGMREKHPQINFCSYGLGGVFCPAWDRTTSARAIFSTLLRFCCPVEFGTDAVVLQRPGNLLRRRCVTRLRYYEAFCN